MQITTEQIDTRARMKVYGLSNIVPIGSAAMVVDVKIENKEYFFFLIAHRIELQVINDFCKTLTQAHNGEVSEWKKTGDETPIKKNEQGNHLIDTIICPYCGYDFWEDKPDLDWPTEKYMIDNNFPVPESPEKLFDEADTYHQGQVGSIEVTCYRCDKKFTANRNIFYASEAIKDTG